MRKAPVLALFICFAILAVSNAFVRDILHYRDILDLDTAVQYKVNKGKSKYPCKEADEVHSIMIEARDQARLLQAANREVVEETAEALVGVGVKEEQLACLVFQLSVNEGIEQ